MSRFRLTIAGMILLFCVALLIGRKSAPMPRPKQPLTSQSDWQFCRAKVGLDETPFRVDLKKTSFIELRLRYDYQIVGGIHQINGHDYVLFAPEQTLYRIDSDGAW